MITEAHWCALWKTQNLRRKDIIDQVVLIKLTILVSRTKSLKTHARNFQEECCIYNLGLKWRRLSKWKEYPFTLENMEKLPIFLYGVCCPKRISKNFYWISTTYAQFLENLPFLIKNLQKFYRLVNGNHSPFQFENCWLD